MYKLLYVIMLMIKITKQKNIKCIYKYSHLSPLGVALVPVLHFKTHLDMGEN